MCACRCYGGSNYIATLTCQTTSPRKYNSAWKADTQGAWRCWQVSGDIFYHGLFTGENSASVLSMLNSVLIHWFVGKMLWFENCDLCCAKISIRNYFLASFTCIVKFPFVEVKVIESLVPGKAKFRLNTTHSFIHLESLCSAPQETYQSCSTVIRISFEQLVTPMWTII